MDSASPNASSNYAVLLLTAPPPGDEADDGALVKIDGRESVMRAMELFVNRAGVSQILLVINPSRAEQYKQKVASHLSFMGIKLIEGGATWAEQCQAARPKLADEVTHIVLHDAARPAVPYPDLDALLSGDSVAPVVALGLPISGMLADVDRVPGAATRSAAHLAQIVTPIVFERGAFNQFCDSGELPVTIDLLRGSPLNVRCGSTEPNFVKAMISLLPKPKVRAANSPFEEAQW